MLQSRDDELTVVTFSDQTPPPPERRTASRNLSVLRTAILRTRRGEELCLVRNISTGGLMAQIFCDLQIDDPVLVEFKSEHSVRGRVVWRRDDLVGVQFSEIIELSIVLSNQFRCTFLPLEPRAPRANVNIPARVQCLGIWRSVTLRNISQGGARLEVDRAAALGPAVMLDAPGLSPVSATVRWHDRDCIGIAFDQPLPFPDVARWVADRHQVLTNSVQPVRVIEASRQ